VAVEILLDDDEPPGRGPPQGLVAEFHNLQARETRKHRGLEISARRSRDRYDLWTPSVAVPTTRNSPDQPSGLSGLQFLLHPGCTSPTMRTVSLRYARRAPFLSHLPAAHARTRSYPRDPDTMTPDSPALPIIPLEPTRVSSASAPILALENVLCCPEPLHRARSYLPPLPQEDVSDGRDGCPALRPAAGN
jgi:hypothetical protein